ncbi:MAG: hypothetical protein K0R57_1399 [Paenibacillaceae bacterium]|jgi:putative aldouronate transport system substrate-binding protein|nr:hypothetical protein [Paenibacillaceae bacterium]
MRKWQCTKVIASVCSLVLLSGLMGCAKEDDAAQTTASVAPSAAATTAASPSPSAAPAVQLKWYYIAYELQPDQQAVEDAVNAYIKPKLNTTVKLMPLIESGYKDKINTMLAANEEIDLLWTSNWGGGDYEPKATKGGFLELDALLDKAPKLKAAFPALIWDDTRINGKIYGVPNYQIAAKAEGFAIQKQYVDKYKLDVSAIKKQSDIEPFLKTLKDNEKDVVPILNTSNMFDFGRHYGYAPRNYKVGDPEYKIIDVPQTPEYKSFLEMVRRWYQAGYVYKDAATAKGDQMEALLKTGKVAVEWNVTMKPGGEADDKKRFGGNDVVYVRLSEPEFTGVQATMTAISKTSKNPERAIQLLELINTDPALFNLLTFGIDGKHYTKAGDNIIKINQAGGYKSDLGWVMGNSLIGYLKEGQPADTWTRTKQLNESAKRPETGSFKFVNDPIKTELANLTTIEAEFSKALNTGAVDYNTYLPKFIEARKKAGVDKVIAERQKQLDDWLKANGKKK